MTVAVFNPATATDGQLHEARELIMSVFEAHNLGKQDWLDAAARKVMREHKFDIEEEQRRRKKMAPS